MDRQRFVELFTALFNRVNNSNLRLANLQNNLCKKSF